MTELEARDVVPSIMKDQDFRNVIKDLFTLFQEESCDDFDLLECWFLGNFTFHEKEQTWRHNTHTAIFLH